MRRADIASSLFWMAVGAFVAWSGWDLELGTVNDPGSGFLLFWLGLIMIGLAAAILVNALREAAGVPQALLAGARWRRVVLVLVALIAYGWALPRLGFIVTTTAVLIFLFKAVEPQRWSVAIGGAVASALSAYLIFKVWLGAQLPAGFLDLG
jgi:putative tricarboxylic transport membrane protein